MTLSYKNQSTDLQSKWKETATRNLAMKSIFKKQHFCGRTTVMNLALFIKNMAGPFLKYS